MTPEEFIAHLAPFDMNRLALVFDWMADHADELRTSGGQRLLDSIDWSAFLHEAAVAARNRESPSLLDLRSPIEIMARPARPPRYDATCPSCGHVHEDEAECRMKMGGGGVCLCDRKVTA
jgi:hypothetical protein